MACVCNKFKSGPWPSVKNGLGAGLRGVVRQDLEYLWWNQKISVSGWGPLVQFGWTRIRSVFFLDQSGTYRGSGRAYKLYLDRRISAYNLCSTEIIWLFRNTLLSSMNLQGSIGVIWLSSYTTLEFAPNPIEISCQGRHVSKYLEELFLSLPWCTTPNGWWRKRVEWNTSCRSPPTNYKARVPGHLTVGFWSAPSRCCKWYLFASKKNSRMRPKIINMPIFTHCKVCAAFGGLPVEHWWLRFLTGFLGFRCIS